MNIQVKDNIVFYIDDLGSRRLLTAKDLFSWNNELVLDGKVVVANGMDFYGLKKSIISLIPTLCFEGAKKKVGTFVEVKKGANTYRLPSFNGCLVDYLLLNNTIYFISNIEFISDLYANEKIKYNSLITFKEYVTFSAQAKQSQILIKDDVLSYVEDIKNNDSSSYDSGLNATLFPYQEQGIRWLDFMCDNQCGCILGDEMGLGKTLQVIGLIGHLKKENPEAKTLVIAPVSLLENWRREIAKFYPSLKVYVHQGSRRVGRYGYLLQFDVIIVSYTTCQSDLSMINMINWDLVALDEAQNIKNPLSNRAKNLKLLNRKMSIVVTGTPFENHMTDIWSLTDFVLPGYLGTLYQFENDFCDSCGSAMNIENYLTPIMIRRKVDEVAKDLPERIDIPQAIEMTEDEAKYYDSERRRVSKDELKTLKISKIQGLRMFCTHPSVYRYSSAAPNVDPATISTKYQRTCEILGEIFSKGEKAILFTSFNRMKDIFMEDIPDRFGVPTNFISGETKIEDRQKIIDNYSSINGPALLVLNPKAAGTGLNITAANHVIHYNLEWNPAVEDQASARSYRRGQTKTVFVYRLYYADTIEDVINERIQRKRTLSDLAVVGNKGDTDEEDLIKALNMSPYKGGNEDGV